METVDLSLCSFEEFVSFFFDRGPAPAPAGVGEPHPWYWSVHVVFDPALMAEHSIRLFSAPGFLALRTPEQLERGFWVLQVDALDCSPRGLIWNDSLPWETRSEIVHSMYMLFERLFSNTPLDTASNMWWDSFCHDWSCGARVRGDCPENDRMQDVMFETLIRVLQLPTRHCQEAALHGLGHLRHPRTEQAIGSFLDGNDLLNEGTRSYARAAARFEVL